MEWWSLDPWSGDVFRMVNQETCTEDLQGRVLGLCCRLVVSPLKGVYHHISIIFNIYIYTYGWYQCLNDAHSLWLLWLNENPSLQPVKFIHSHRVDSREPWVNSPAKIWKLGGFPKWGIPRSPWLREHLKLDHPNHWVSMGVIMKQHQKSANSVLFGPLLKGLSPNTHVFKTRLFRGAQFQRTMEHRAVGKSRGPTTLGTAEGDPLS